MEERIIYAKRMNDMNAELIKIQERITQIVIIQQKITEDLLTTQKNGAKNEN